MWRLRTQLAKTLGDKQRMKHDIKDIAELVCCLEPEIICTCGYKAQNIAQWNQHIASSYGDALDELDRATEWRDSFN